MASQVTFSFKGYTNGKTTAEDSHAVRDLQSQIALLVREKTELQNKLLKFSDVFNRVAKEKYSQYVRDIIAKKNAARDRFLMSLGRRSATSVLPFILKSWNALKRREKRMREMVEQRLRRMRLAFFFRRWKDAIWIADDERQRQYIETLEQAIARHEVSSADETASEKGEKSNSAPSGGNATLLIGQLRELQWKFEKEREKRRALEDKMEEAEQQMTAEVRKREAAEEELATWRRKAEEKRQQERSDEAQKSEGSSRQSAEETLSSEAASVSEEVEELLTRLKVEIEKRENSEESIPLLARVLEATRTENEIKAICNESVVVNDRGSEDKGALSIDAKELASVDVESPEVKRGGERSESQTLERKATNTDRRAVTLTREQTGSLREMTRCLAQLKAQLHTEKDAIGSALTQAREAAMSRMNAIKERALGLLDAGGQLANTFALDRTIVSLKENLAKAKQELFEQQNETVKLEQRLRSTADELKLEKRTTSDLRKELSEKLEFINELEHTSKMERGIISDLKSRLEENEAESQQLKETLETKSKNEAELASTITSLRGRVENEEQKRKITVLDADLLRIAQTARSAVSRKDHLIEQLSRAASEEMTRSASILQVVLGESGTGQLQSIGKKALRAVSALYSTVSGIESFREMSDALANALQEEMTISMLEMRLLEEVLSGLGSYQSAALAAVRSDLEQTLTTEESQSTSEDVHSTDMATETEVEEESLREAEAESLKDKVLQWVTRYPLSRRTLIVKLARKLARADDRQQDRVVTVEGGVKTILNEAPSSPSTAPMNIFGLSLPLSASLVSEASVKNTPVNSPYRRKEKVQYSSAKTKGSSTGSIDQLQLPPMEVARQAWQKRDDKPFNAGSPAAATPRAREPVYGFLESSPVSSSARARPTFGRSHRVLRA